MSDDGLAGRVEAELRAQGLIRPVADPDVIRRIVGLLGAEDPNAREKRLAEARDELANLEVRLRLGEGLS